MNKSPSSHGLPNLPITRKSFPPDALPKKSTPPTFREKSPVPQPPSEESEKIAAVSSAIREIMGRTSLNPTLSILRGLKAGRIFELLGESIMIGRNSNCDLVLPDEVVSRNHARVRARTDGLYIEDLGSRNGTFVNGKRITQPTKLANGDYIQVYELLLSFHEAGTGSGSIPRPTVLQHDIADWSAEDSNIDATSPPVNRERHDSSDPQAGPVVGDHHDNGCLVDRARAR